jgi:hypothetical protein
MSLTTTTMQDWLSRLAGCQNQTPETPHTRTDEPGDSPEIIMVTYQRIWFDYDLRDGSYTPAELQQAKLLVKSGAVLRYRLRWPGGRPQPIEVVEDHASRFRSKPHADGAPVVAVQRRTYSGHTGPGIKRL